MSIILTALILSSIGTVRDEGHCLDQRAFVLTRHEFKSVETELAALRAEVAALNRKLAASKREAAAALESQSQCLTAPMPVCDCSEWSAGVIGAGVSMVACGTFWLGARL